MATLQDAHALFEGSNYITASKVARELINKDPSNFNARLIEVRSLLAIGHDLQRCRESAEALVKAVPDNASAHHTLGCCVAALGDIDAAKQSLGKALKLDPLYASSHFELATLYKFRSEDDPRLAQMLKAVELAKAKGDVPDAILFGLAKAYDDLKQPEKAMPYALEANRLANRDFDRDDLMRSMKGIEAAVKLNKLKAKAGAGSVSREPIFIVGMPRSGTTLTEIILSRHPDVTACGELPLIGSARRVLVQAAEVTLKHKGPLDPVLHKLKQDYLRQAAEQYLLHAKRRNNVTTAHFTDKMPGNVRRLGLISRLFPNAKIVYVRRHPLDNAMSNFFTRFSASGMGFSFDLETLGLYSRKNADSAEMWRDAIPNPMLDVCYEMLVTDPEPQIRRLIDFVGLEWDDNCLTPEQSSATVFTASRSQVRQSINTSSKGRWEAYEPWLGPLIEAMGGMDWVEAQVADARERGSV